MLTHFTKHIGKKPELFIRILIFSHPSELRPPLQSTESVTESVRDSHLYQCSSQLAANLPVQLIHVQKSLFIEA